MGRRHGGRWAAPTADPGPPGRRGADGPAIVSSRPPLTLGVVAQAREGGDRHGWTAQTTGRGGSGNGRGGDRRLGAPFEGSRHPAPAGSRPTNARPAAAILVPGTLVGVGRASQARRQGQCMCARGAAGGGGGVHEPVAPCLPCMHPPPGRCCCSVLQQAQSGAQCDTGWLLRAANTVPARQRDVGFKGLPPGSQPGAVGRSLQHGAP